MGKRRWRHYETSTGRQPVKEFLETLNEEDVAAVAAAMKEVRENGLRSARHRLLFAPQGSMNQVLLTLAAFKKKTQKTPPQMIRLAQRRLRDWEQRGSTFISSKISSC